MEGFPCNNKLPWRIFGNFNGGNSLVFQNIFQLLAPKLLFRSVMDDKLSFSAMVFPNRSLGTSSGGLFKGNFSNSQNVTNGKSLGLSFGSTQRDVVTSRAGETNLLKEVYDL
jgi:hypothetical protein